MKNVPIPKLPGKPCFAMSKYKSYQSLVKKIWFFFTVEKYQFYSHLICIEFTAYDKINTIDHHDLNVCIVLEKVVEQNWMLLESKLIGCSIAL